VSAGTEVTLSVSNESWTAETGDLPAMRLGHSLATLTRKCHKPNQKYNGRVYHFGKHYNFSLLDVTPCSLLFLP
jgi:hypothetical protein